MDGTPSQWFIVAVSQVMGQVVFSKVSDSLPLFPSSGDDCGVCREFLPYYGSRYDDTYGTMV